MCIQYLRLKFPKCKHISSIETIIKKVEYFVYRKGFFDSINKEIDLQDKNKKLA